MAILHLFESKEDTSNIYYSKMSYASYKIYFNGNISNTNIGLNVQINGKVYTHTCPSISPYFFGIWKFVFNSYTYATM